MLLVEKESKVRAMDSVDQWDTGCSKPCERRPDSTLTQQGRKTKHSSFGPPDSPKSPDFSDLECHLMFLQQKV